MCFARMEIRSAFSGYWTEFQVLRGWELPHCWEAAAQCISAWTCVQLLTKQTKIKCLQSV